MGSKYVVTSKRPSGMSDERLYIYIYIYIYIYNCWSSWSNETKANTL